MYMNETIFETLALLLESMSSPFLDLKMLLWLRFCSFFYKNVAVAKVLEVSIEKSLCFVSFF